MSEAADSHRSEVARGERFEFGRNWRRFLRVLDDDRIALAERSLATMLEVQSLGGKSFLDIGSGSGLFSLAARSLGARVTSFDYDPQSVACTGELRRRYRPRDADWTIEQASVLDAARLAALGQFDVVYCWGVLHHTGHMWEALDNVKGLVRPGGTLFIALYNDLGAVTDRWARIKRWYNALPRPLAALLAFGIVAAAEGKSLLRHVCRGRAGGWLASWRHYARDDSARGMSKWHDWIDWIGGYPYERATVAQVVDRLRPAGFHLRKMVDRSHGWGCNEFVFRRDSGPPEAAR